MDCLLERDTGRKKALSVRWNAEAQKNARPKARPPHLAPQRPTHNAATGLVPAAVQPRLIGQRALGGGGSSSPWRPGVLCPAGDRRRLRFLPAMSGLRVQRDLQEAAALERRRQRELQRQGRIFNARVRTIGVRALPKPPRGSGRGWSCGAGSPLRSVWAGVAPGRGGKGQQTSRGSLWRADILLEGCWWEWGAVLCSCTPVGFVFSVGIRKSSGTYLNSCEESVQGVTIVRFPLMCPKSYVKILEKDSGKDERKSVMRWNKLKFCCQVASEGSVVITSLEWKLGAV